MLSIKYFSKCTYLKLWSCTIDCSLIVKVLGGFIKLKKTPARVHSVKIPTLAISSNPPSRLGEN